MHQLPSFDDLMELNNSDPQAFEYLRSELVTEYIESSPENIQPRLQGLQFHINARRDMAKNPIDSCLIISRMMQDSFSEMRGSLQDLCRLTSNLQSAKSLPINQPLDEAKTSAKIFDLEKLRLSAVE